jgi:hypothetical protein
MAKPYIHAVSSARRFGGTPNDYLPIHVFLDSSKGTIADSRHRALTHTSWFIMEILPAAFGETMVVQTAKGERVVSVRDIGEQHVLEDFGGRFIPSPQDYLEHMEVKEWMVAGRGVPPSSAVKLENSHEKNRD